MKSNTINRNGLKLSASSIALSLLATAIPVSAVAQDDEIIVTATKRAESIQDIPLNISAIGGDDIEQQGFGDLSELAAFVPGINIVDAGGRDGNRIVVRGLNAEPIRPAFGQENGGGTVATYVGEIPTYIDFRLNDIERVEVLLGPQGTLYGAGTMGGAIRYIPSRPSFEGPSGYVSADVYSYSEGDDLSTDFGAMFNLPLSDRFAVRASVDYLDDGGFIDYPFVVQEVGVSDPDPDFSDPAALAANFSPVDDANTEEMLSGRVAMRWQPIDAIDANLTYYFQSEDIGGRSTSGIRTTISTDEYESPYRVLEPLERDNELLALEVTADLGFAELTSATSAGEKTLSGQRDQTDLLITLEYSYELFPTFTAFTFEDEKTETFNQELRLVSTNDGPFNWIVGAFYNKNEYRALSSEFTPGYVEDFGVPLPASGSLEYFAATRSQLVERAIFGELGYEITPKWDVTVGMRLYEYELEDANLTEFPVADYLFFGADGTYEAFGLGEIDQNLTLAPNQEEGGELFKINTSYQFDNGNLIYATFSQGYRVGITNAGEPCTDDAFADPNQGLCLYSPGQQFSADPADIVLVDERAASADTVDNYELGAKTTWLDGALQVTGSVYLMEWNDPQVAATSINASTSIQVNALGAETKGFDLAADWDVTDNFNLRGTFSHVKAELTEDTPGIVRSIVDTGGFGTLTLDGEAGDRLPGAPENQFSLFGSYDKPLDNGNSVVFDAGYSWQGEVSNLIGEKGGNVNLPSYGRLNAAVSYNADRWTAQLYADNLTDDFSESSIALTPRFNQTIEGANVRSYRSNVLPPRTVGVRLKYNFN